MSRDYSVNKKILKFMILAIFLIPYFLREPFLKNYAYINFIFIVLLLLYIVKNYNYMKINEFCFVSLICILIFINDYFFNKNDVITILKITFMDIIPIFMLSVKLSRDEVLHIFPSLLKIFNFFIIIIFIIGIIDPFLNYSIMRSMGNLVNNVLTVWISGNRDRYTSYMGHALFTKDLFLMFYLLNSVYNHKIGNFLMNKYIIMGISVIGILLTGSKTGVIAIIVCLVVANRKSINIVSIINSTIILLFVYFFGFFNSVIYRFQNSSLTTGRTEAWELLSHNTVLQLQLFSGYGEKLNEIVTNYIGQDMSTAAFEYPIRILLYKYGIICFALIMAYLFVYPILYFLKRKEYFLLFNFLIMAVDVNTYNGLLYAADTMILFVIYTSLLLGLGKEVEQQNDNFQ